MIRLIINPTAGIGSGKVAAEEAIAYLKSKNIPFEVRYTEQKGHGTELARKAVEDGIDTVIAFGGDGSIAEVARGLCYTQTKLGIVPCGTGNDFVKAAHIPTETKAAIDLILEKSARPVDSGLLNDLFFLNIMGCGFDVMTLENAESVKKHCKGIWPYLIGLLKTIAQYKPFDMTIRIDGKDVSRPTLICAVANGTNFGGGMPIAPDARIDDGTFDVVLIDDLKKATMLKVLPKLLKGKHISYHKTHVFHAEEVYLKHPHMKVELDGEVIPVEEAHIKIQKDSILLYC